MKIYLLALSLLFTTLAMAQPPVKTADDKPKETKEKKQDKPKEKKEKKDRTFRLIGVDASIGNLYYNTGREGYKPTTTSGMYKGFIDKNSPFFTYFGNNTPTSYGGSYLYIADYYNNKRWANESQQYNFTTTWGFGKKGNVNQRHVIKIGAGYANRSYNGTAYTLYDYSSTDTTGYSYVNGDTIAFIKDTSSAKMCTLSNYVSMGQVSLAYNYRLHPEEKLSLSFGGGVDIAMGVFEIFGYLNQELSSRSYEVSTSSTSPWYYYANQGNTYKSSNLAIISDSKFKAVTFRPYINARIDYRLSKNFPILKHINIFVDGRWGKEFSNINKKMYAKSPTYLGLSFGIAYTFHKGL